jgi:hypothetical protein
VHLTLGILRKSQAVFYAFSFFWLDGFAVPAPAQVTQTVSCGYDYPNKKETNKVSVGCGVSTLAVQVTLFVSLSGRILL